MYFFWMSMLITHTFHIKHTFPKIPQLPDLEYLYRWNGFWNIINTLSNIILNKIHDIIDSNSSTSVKNSHISGNTCTKIVLFSHDENYKSILFCIEKEQITTGKKVSHFQTFWLLFTSFQNVRTKKNVFVVTMICSNAIQSYIANVQFWVQGFFLQENM